MIRNYALIVAGFTSRLWGPVLAYAVQPEINDIAYRGDQLAVGHDIASGSAWLALVATVLVAEAYIQRRYGVRSAGERLRQPAGGRGR